MIIKGNLTSPLINCIAILLLLFQCMGAAGQPNKIIWDKYSVGDGSIEIENRPMDYQLYPRKANNKAKVTFSGTINGCASIKLVAIKTGLDGYRSIYHEKIIPVINSRFRYSIEINSELSEYGFYYKPEGNLKYLKIADQVVCGDAYLISGQSNADTPDLTQQELDSLNIKYGGGTAATQGSPYGKYSRSFGCGAPFKGSNRWGLSSVNINGCLHTGAWGLQLQYLVQKNYGIPTCVINGAMGGTAITRNHLPADEVYFFNPTTDSLKKLNNENLFARLNTRVYAAGLQDDISGIFWMQGDGGDHDDKIGYTAEFGKLHALWRKFYPGFKHTYMIQVHSWVEAEGVMRELSEAQRTAPKNFPNTSVMSANGIGYHRPEGGREVHFQSKGYEELGRRLFRQLEKVNYGETKDMEDIAPPDITAVSRKGNTITLFFNQELDVKNSDSLENILSVIKFDTGYGKKSNPKISGNKYTFDVADTNVSRISYAGYIPEAIVYEPRFANADFRCYLKNSKNIGALSFHNFPVAIYDPGILEWGLSQLLPIYHNPLLLIVTVLFFVTN